VGACPLAWRGRRQQKHAGRSVGCKGVISIASVWDYSGFFSGIKLFFGKIISPFVFLFKKALGLPDDPLFSGRGSPAFMSLKEPALKLLHERYSESFALTRVNEKQVHLFLVKVGLWSLVWTFVPRDVGTDNIQIDQALLFIENAMKKENPFVAKLDSSVAKAKERIGKKISEFSWGALEK
jgi:hypothetical protein